MAGLAKQVRTHDLSDLDRQLAAAAADVGTSGHGQPWAWSRVMCATVWTATMSTAFAAVWARLMRVAERSLCTDKDLLDQRSDGPQAGLGPCRAAAERVGFGPSCHSRTMPMPPCFAIRRPVPPASRCFSARICGRGWRPARRRCRPGCKATGSGGLGEVRLLPAADGAGGGAVVGIGTAKTRARGGLAWPRRGAVPCQQATGVWWATLEPAAARRGGAGLAAGAVSV